jgi:signal transduction histidine kinase
MTFRNKILLSIWGVVLSLLVITFIVINFWARSRIGGSLSGELRTGVSTVQVHEQLQSSQLIRACVVVAESPRLRAVAELGDPRTASQLLQELTPATQSQIFLLTDRTGRLLVQLFRGTPRRQEFSSHRTIDEALAYRTSTDVWVVEGGAYRIVTVPILIEDDLVGTLTMGFKISTADLSSLKRATNCDLLIGTDSLVIAATLDTTEARALLRSITDAERNIPPAPSDTTETSLTLATQDETYLASRYRLSRDTSSSTPAVSFLIIKPLGREVRGAMASMMQNLGVLSLLFLVLTTVVGLVISRSMTRPIAALITGTDEISKGNYDYVMDVRGADELNVLARRFMAMSASLKTQIAQMARLNQDLTQRNEELDDTLRKLRAAQEELVRSERLAATGKMTAQLAHEINNPIHNIQSCLQTALNRLPADVKGKDLIETAYGESGRLSRLTLQMLNFYRTALVEDIMKPTDLNQLLREVVILTKADLEQRHIAVETAFDPACPTIRGSRDKLKQVFLNLITNARDAMPGGGTLWISTALGAKNVQVKVGDTGVGIPRENLNRIFDAFFTTKGKVSGVGLGLSVTYGIVSQHRGSIDVESAVGKGTTFTINLPSEEKV